VTTEVGACLLGDVIAGRVKVPVIPGTDSLTGAVGTKPDDGAEVALAVTQKPISGSHDRGNRPVHAVFRGAVLPVAGALGSR
jgi:hypothetical protein